MVLESTQPQEYFLAVNAGDAQDWQPCQIHVPIVLKSGRLNFLEPSGPVQDFFTFYL
jgi:hypothetical protein